MVSELVNALDRRFLQSFMDIIVLRFLKGRNFPSGYDVVKFIQLKFHVTLSCSTVYSCLYSLERKGLLIGAANGRKRVYKLSKSGEDFLTQALATKRRNLILLSSVFSDV